MPARTAAARSRSAAPGRDPQPFDVSVLGMSNQSLTGVFLGAEIATERAQQMIAGLVDDVGAGRLEVVVDRTFPLADAAEAHAFLESRQAVGRVVLDPMSAADQATKAEQFLALHHGDDPLLLPNPWDAGRRRSWRRSGSRRWPPRARDSPATLGRLDGGVTRDELLDHARVIVAATDLPVSADMENCFADDPAGVAETIGLAIETGLVGGSCEDFSGNDGDPIYDASLATERVAAAVEAAHQGPVHFVLTGAVRELPARHRRLRRHRRPAPRVPGRRRRRALRARA